MTGWGGVYPSHGDGVFWPIRCLVCTVPHGYLGTSRCLLFKQVSAIAVSELGEEGAGGGEVLRFHVLFLLPLPSCHLCAPLVLKF